MSQNLKFEDLIGKAKGDWRNEIAWKAIIFLPYNLVWQCFIAVAVIVQFYVCTYRFTYDDPSFLAIIYCCDMMYVCDVVCAALHYNMPKTRKLKNWQPRHWFLLTVDIFSVIPFEMAYATFIIDKSTHWTRNEYILYLNRCLRLYRVYLCFSVAKLRMQKMHFHVISGFLEVCIYEYLMSHVFSCIWHVLGTPEDIASCYADRLACLLHNEFNFMYVIGHHFIGDKKIINTVARRFLVILTILTGYVFIYGMAIPVLIFTYLKFLRPFFDFSKRYNRLKMFVDNVIENKELKEKTLKHFRSVWSHGTGETEPRILKAFPLSFQKNISCDMHWEAMRHSELLQNTSKSFKRSLSMYFVTEFIMPGMTILEIGEVKSKIMYLAAGVLQIMAEENSESPVLSFSAGTVLGEISCFLQTKSKAILRSATFSEIHTLKYIDLFRVLLDYPHDRKEVFRLLYLRLQMAKITQFRKAAFGKELSINESGGFFAESEDAVKWIKEQYRALSEMHKQELLVIKARQEGTAVPILRHHHQLKTSLDHISNFLELLSLSDAVEVKTDVVCLHTKFPWIVEPGSHFLSHWNKIVLLVVIFSVVIYPYFTGWRPQPPEWFADFSIFVTSLYILDVCIQASTAVKTKDVLIDKFWAILRYRLQSISFYGDLVAALPLQVFLLLNTKQKDLPDYQLCLSCSISLLKVYRIVIFFNAWMKKLNVNTSFLCMIKYVVLLVVSVYFTAAILQLTGVACVMYECESTDWYPKFLELAGPSFKDIASVFFAVVIGLDMPVTDFFASALPSAMMVIILSVILVFFSFMWYGEYIATYISEKLHELKFKGLMELITKFMNNYRLAEKVKERVTNTMKFQWYFDYGDYLTQRRTMLQDAPFKLRQEIDRDSVYKTIKKCDFFVSESEEFLEELCTSAERLALPAGSIVVTFGTQTMCLYLVHRGFCQINSFLPNDINNGVASSMLSSPGNIFPVIVALNQIPSAVTSFTLTDCELILLQLEDVLRAMTNHGAFKDTVNAIKETDLTPLLDAELAASKKHKQSKVNLQTTFSAPFKKMKCVGLLLRLVLLRTTFDPQSRGYVLWEFSRVVVMAFCMIMWPMTFGLLMVPQRQLIQYILYGLDSIYPLDMYIRLHLQYYNNKGILVTHPLYTAWHYITTNFIIDFVAWFPFNMLYKMTTDTRGLITETYALVLPSAIKLLGLYRINSFIRHHEELSEYAYGLKMFKYTIVSIIVLNGFVNVRCRLDATWKIQPNGEYTFVMNSNASWLKALELDTPLELYAITLYGTFVTMFRKEYYFLGWKPRQVIVSVCLSLVGWVISILIFSFFTSKAKSSKVNFTVYQYRMKSFVSYLNTEKTEDSVAIQAIDHIEHEWEKRQGEELEKIFMRFPNILHEDLTYPLYKSTINAVHCLAEANEAFYRQLSRFVIPVYFKKGTAILFRNHVHKNLYFVRNGQCLVKDLGVVLYRGSLFGDIRRTGITTHKIKASTHVDLLKISSDTFYRIMNNFYGTERSFMENIQGVDDYVESEFIVVTFKEHKLDEDVNHLDETVAPTIFEQSQFEVITYKKDTEESAPTLTGKLLKNPSKSKFFIHPEEPRSQVWNSLLLVVAYLTVILIPIFITMRTASLAVLVFIEVLDIIWTLKIILGFFTAYVDRETGDLIVTRTAIFKRYLQRFDGLIPDLLAVTPFEIMQLLYAFFTDTRVNYQTVQFTLLFRLLRLGYLWNFYQEQSKRLSVSFYMRWMMTLGTQVFIINSFVAYYLAIATADGPALTKYYSSWTHEQTNALVWGYLYVVNLFTGTGLMTFQPQNFTQMAFVTQLALVAVFEKGVLINQVLSIINVAYHSKSEFMHNLQLLETYLTVRDVSPALVSRVRDYGTDLLELYRAEAMPWFLVHAPDVVKVNIMKDLYMSHLSECYLFQGLSTDFLKQLASRLQRYIYFPGDMIVEKGDVDYNMYFIHRGEVICLEMDSVYSSLEGVVDIYRADEYFGQMQGLWKSTPHVNTYRARTVVDLLSLDYRHWSDLRLCFPEITGLIFEKARASFEVRIRTRVDSI